MSFDFDAVMTALARVDRQRATIRNASMSERMKAILSKQVDLQVKQLEDELEAQLVSQAELQLKPVSTSTSSPAPEQGKQAAKRA